MSDRIPIVKSLHIEGMSGTSITIANYFNINAIIGEYTDGTIYATQRPSFDIWEDASATVSDARGRGIYFWEAANDWYIVNNNTVYKTNYSGTQLSITGGIKPVYFVEMVNFLVILDPENNEGWYINSSTPGVITKIMDADFPGQASLPSAQLTTGGVFLDGRMYVADTSGTIYNSDSNTPATWNTAGVGYTISAEREADDGVHIAKHHDHVVLMGTRTIEFFYNAGNTTGSPLSRRSDLAYNIGCLQGDAVFQEGDDLYFCAVAPSGPLHVVRMSNFQYQHISEPDIETYLTNARLVEQSEFIASGFTTGDRTFYCLTLYRLSGGDISPDSTIVFDSMTWGTWQSASCGCGNFPLVAWTIRSGSTAQSGAGILSNGDAVQIRDDFNPVDTILAAGYILDGYIASGYYTSTGGPGSNIQFLVRTGPFDNKNSRWKFHHALEIAADKTVNAETCLLRWYDGNSKNSSVSSDRIVNLDKKEKVTRMGRFTRRNWEIEYNGDEQIRVEGVDIDITEGGH